MLPRTRAWVESWQAVKDRSEAEVQKYILGKARNGFQMAKKPSRAQRDAWVTLLAEPDKTADQLSPLAMRVIDRRAVFLVRNGDSVTALDSTCTHLGCRVSWNSESQQLKCPCHGGTYDRDGKVTSGPPPEPLARFATRVESDGRVMVQL